MTPPLLLAFAGAVLIFAATPGPGVMAVTGESLGRGWREGLKLAAGLVAGDGVYLLLVLLGLAVIAERLGEFFDVLRYLGGGYLIYLGIRLWRQAGRVDETQMSPARPAAPFVRGFLISLGNPKVIVFYVGFLPAFWDIAALGGGQKLTIFGLNSSVCFTVLGTYAVLAHQSRRFLNHTAQRVLRRVAAVFLGLTGARIVIPFRAH